MVLASFAASILCFADKLTGPDNHPGQWFSTGVILSLHTLGDIWQNLETILVGTGGGGRVYWHLMGRKKPGILLNILQCPDNPTTKDCLAQMSTALSLRNPGMEPFLWWPPRNKNARSNLYSTLWGPLTLLFKKKRKANNYIYELLPLHCLRWTDI